MSTSLEANKITLQWPDFTKQPINSFKLPEWHLSFRGNIAEQRDISPEDYVDYDIDLNSDELFYKHLYSFQSKENPFLYINLGEFSCDVLQRGGGYTGGIYVTVSIARIQNVPEVTNIQKPEELTTAVQFNFDREDDGERWGSDYCWIDVNSNSFLRENRSHKRSCTTYIFYFAIDYRHVLIVNTSFSGYAPIGEKLPPELLDALMDGVKEFLSHIQLEKIED